MKKNRPWSLFCRFCHGCGSACLVCLNTFLAVLAIGLTGVILLNSLQRVIPTPNRAVKTVLHSALGGKFQAEWDNLVIDLGGGLFLEGFTLARRDADYPFLTADTVRVNLSLLGLVIGQDFPVEDLQVSQLTLFVPPEHSRTGLPEPGLNVLDASIVLREGHLHLHHLLAGYEEATCFVSGKAPLHRLLVQEEGGGSSDLSWSILPLGKIPPHEGMTGRLQWSLDESGRHQFNGLLSARAMQFGGLQLGGLLAQCGFSFMENGLSFSLLKVEGAVDAFVNTPPFPGADLFQPDFPVRFSLHSSGDPAPFGTVRLPSRITLALAGALQSPFRINTASLRLQAPFDPLLVDWTLKGPEAFIRGEASPLPKESPSSFPFSLRLQAYLEYPFLNQIFPSLPAHRLLENGHARLLRLHARYHGPEQPRWSGLLIADNLHIGQSDFAHLRSPFLFQDHWLRFRPVHVVKTPGQSASGSYLHHLPSAQFSLNAAGSLLPESLDAILGRWWQRIFTHIRASEPLQGDVTVWGFWPDQDSLRSVTGVAGTGASYRGKAIPDLRVLIRSNEEWAYLEELEARFPNGEVEGSMAWRQGIEEGEYRPMVLDFRSQAGWDAVVAASGIEALDQLEFSGQPGVRAKGVIWTGPRSASREERRMIPELDVSLRHPSGSTRIAGLSLEDLRLSGRVRDSEIDLDNLSGTFAQGVFTGKLRIRNWNQPESRVNDLRLQVFDADYVEAVQGLSLFTPDPEGMRKALLQEHTHGRIDTNLDLRLSPTPGSSAGSGQITLRDASISRIHLFGGLSRFLDDLGLGFSSLNLNTGSIDWELRAGILEIPDCILTGPILSLDASGEINLQTRFIHMKADLLLLSGLLSKVLSPVSNNFSFSVSGPLEEPSWNLRLNPLGLFREAIPGEGPANGRL